MLAELEHWHDFYVLVGTAGATLVALLFVAISLGTGFINDKRAAATRAFYSPVVVHFSAVFFLAAVALVPAHRAAFFAAMIGACAAVGLGVSLFVTFQLLRHDWTSYKEDHLAYALLPTLAYMALLVAAAMVWSKRFRARRSRRFAASAADRQYPQRVGPHALDGAPSDGAALMALTAGRARF